MSDNVIDYARRLICSAANIDRDSLMKALILVSIANSPTGEVSEKEMIQFGEWVGNVLTDLSILSLVLDGSLRCVDASDVSNPSFVMTEVGKDRAAALAPAT